MNDPVRTTRRRFLEQAAASAILAPVLASTAFSSDEGSAAKGEQPVKPLPFSLGVQSYTFRKFPAEDVIKKAKALGVSFIEFYPGHLPMDLPEEKAAAIRAECRRSNLALPAYGVVGFSADEAKNRAAFESAKRNGIGILTANPTRESLANVESLAAEFDVKVAIHNHGPGSLYSTVDDVLGALAGRDERMGACVDTGHFLRSHVDPAGAVRLLGPRVIAVHLKDIRSNEDHTNVVNGRGILDLGALLAALDEVGFTGPMAIEYEADPDDPGPATAECIAELRKAAGA